MGVVEDMPGAVRRRRSIRVREPRDGVGGECVSGDERQGLGWGWRSPRWVDALGVEVLEDLPDDGRVDDEGEDAHLGPAGTQQWIDLADPAQELGPTTPLRGAVPPSQPLAFGARRFLLGRADVGGVEAMGSLLLSQNIGPSPSAASSSGDVGVDGMRGPSSVAVTVSVLPNSWSSS